jgi:hypothetical protein
MVLCSSQSELPDEAGTASSGELDEKVECVEHMQVLDQRGALVCSSSE